MPINDDIDMLQKANVPVPETLEELATMLEVAEKESRRLSFNEAFEETRKRMDARFGTGPKNS